MKKRCETGKRESHVLLESVKRARTRHNKVCKVDHIMKFEVNMIRYSEAKPLFFFFFFYPYSLARNNLMYQSKIIFPPG